MIIQFDITGGQVVAVRSEMITCIHIVDKKSTCISLLCGKVICVSEGYADVVAKIRDTENREDPNPCQVNQTEFKIHAD